MNYVKEYLEGKSISEIAEKYLVNSATVYRILKKFGVKIRSKSEAQKAALKSGRAKHPTKGRQRTQEEKDKISQSLKEKQ